YKKGLTKEELLKKAESERDPKKRDGFLYKAAIIATQEENYEEALKIADEMSEYADETTKPYIKYNVCRKLIGINEVDRALVISQKDKDASRKASIFVFGARKLLQDKTNIYQVSLFLAEAQKLAEKMSGGKALMLIAISTVYSEFDMSSALETLGEAIKATNSQKGFNGKEKLQRSFDEGNGFYIFYELLDSKMNFKSLMPKMSAKSFLNTLQSIQSIENTGFRLRANAMLCKNQILVWR
ncbi:MAG: hypothetical protein ACRD6X_20885, partial [Pyrinomonadaceae bacterium]